MQRMTKPIMESDMMGKQSNEIKNSFNKLPVSEKTRLRNEFYKKHPKYHKAHKLNVFLDKGVKPTIYVATTLFIFVLLTEKILSAKKILTTGNFLTQLFTIVLTFLLTVITISLLIALFLIPKKRYRAILIEKRFWRFITVEKNMNYTVNFDSKDFKNKEIFDNMDIDTGEKLWL